MSRHLLVAPATRPRRVRAWLRYLLVPSAAMGVAALLAAGCISRPVPMPVVVPLSCAKASCGLGSCDDGGGTRAAVCSCAPGQFRVRPFQCVTPLQQAPTPGSCTAPEHCSRDEACERLTGKCVQTTAAMCGDAARPTGGAQVKGGFCFVNHPPDGQVSGCGTVDADDICAHGLLCASTSPEQISLICGYPQNRAGVCRTSCDPCGEGLECGDYEGCFLVTTDAGHKGVCMPIGLARGDCGEIQCAPGESCSLGGTLGGLAVGKCERFCDPRGQDPARACPSGQLCEQHSRFDDIGICRSVTR